jgi:hypothetical protein
MQSCVASIAARPGFIAATTGYIIYNNRMSGKVNDNSSFNSVIATETMTDVFETSF